MAADNTSEELVNEGLGPRGLSIQGSVDESTVVVGDRNVINQGPNYYTTNVFGAFDSEQFSVRPSQQLSREEYRWRQVLVQNVKRYWIEGVLERSLHNQALIELGLEERVQAVASPIGSAEEFIEDTGRPFPVGTQATDIFDGLGAGRTLLILGEPGAGKTTILLKLTKTLIARIGDDFSQSIPVVLNLSSWAKKRKPIAEWLVQDLYETFQVSKSLGTTWIKEEQLTLCLDGLDEVAVEHRDDCLQALNQFLQAHGRTEVVVCSRIRDYEALSERLKVKCAIYVQPLTEPQIDQYLEQAGEQLSALNAVFSHSPEIKSFAASPLILSVMSLAYRGSSFNAFSNVDSAQDFRQQLFDAYIERMFLRHRNRQLYAQKQTEQGLCFLAKNMTATAQTVFFIENVQPSWLRSKPEKILYKVNTIILSSLIGKLIIMLVHVTASIILWITFYHWGPEMDVDVNFLFLISSLTASLNTGFLESSLLGLMVLLTGGDIRVMETLAWNWASAKNYVTCFLNDCTWLIPGLIGGFIGWQKDPIIGLVLGLSVLIIFDTARWDNRKIGVPNWSWKLFTTEMTALLPALLGGVIALGGIRGLLVGTLWRGVSIGVISGTLLGFFLGLLNSCISYKKLAVKAYPNQGIWNSAKNALLVASIIGAFSFAIFGLYAVLRLFNSELSYPQGYLWISLLNAFNFSLTAALVTGFSNGGITCLRHIVLRFMLYQSRYSPLNYARFLDYATDKLFLQKVGGGYIFIHRMLLEHFAQMKLEQKPSK